MADKRGMITLEDLEFIRARYAIPEMVELFAPEQGETFKDRHLGCICLNKSMLKAGVEIPFEFMVAEGVLIEWRERLLEVSEALSSQAGLGAAPKIASLTQAIVIDVEEEVLPLAVVVSEGVAQFGPGVRPGVLVPDLEVVSVVSPEEDSSRARDVLVKELVAQCPKKIAQAHERESANPRVEAEGLFLAGLAVKGRRGPTPVARVDLGCTSSVQGDKILRDLIHVESRAIRESAALGWELSLYTASRGPRELMFLKFLPDVWRELKDLEEKALYLGGVPVSCVEEVVPLGIGVSSFGGFVWGLRLRHPSGNALRPLLRPVLLRYVWRKRDKCRLNNSCAGLRVKLKVSDSSLGSSSRLLRGLSERRSYETKLRRVLWTSLQLEM
ncbi:hypothetical protein ACLOJK_034898 [Asimina triloba]